MYTGILQIYYYIFLQDLAHVYTFSNLHNCYINQQGYS